MHRLILTVLILASALSLQSCWTAVVSTAAAGAIVYKREAIEQKVSDFSIKTQINHKLFANAALWENNRVIVGSVDGYVLLTGQVRTETLKAKVLALVKPITGIRRLYDQITVAEPIGTIQQAKDTFITSVITTKMLFAKDFDPSNVKVITDNGIVYLMGTVDSEQADKASDIASKTAGVTKVVRVFNYIT